MKKFESEIQLIISPAKPGSKERICGQVRLNLYFYVKNFILSMNKQLNKNEEFKKVLFRQTSRLSRCPDRDAKISLGLAICEGLLTAKGESGQVEGSSICSRNDTSLISMKSFSKVSWIQKKSKYLSQDG